LHPLRATLQSATLSMKSLAIVSVALVLGAGSVLGQANRPLEATRPAESPALAVPAGEVPELRNSPVKAVAPTKSGAAYIPPAGPTAPILNLWKLVESAGWVMIPLGVMSVLAVMLTLMFLATLRRSAILTPHYMNTADVLLKKRDYPGCWRFPAGTVRRWRGWFSERWILRPKIRVRHSTW
jgi:hypothetical protein